MNGYLLIIDDERYAAEMMRHAFMRQGFPTMTAHTATTAHVLLQSTQVAAVLLDIALPDASGLDFCRWLRQRDPKIAIIITSGYSELNIRLQAFAAGADDFVIKPIVMAELLARLHAVLRHQGSQAPVVLQVAGMELQMLTGQLTLPDGIEVYLNPYELQIMILLLRHAGELMSYQTIATTLASDGGQREVVLQKIELHLHHLVFKIEKDRGCVRYLQIVPGRGARILVPQMLQSFARGRLPH